MPRTAFSILPTFCTDGTIPSLVDRDDLSCPAGGCHGYGNTLPHIGRTRPVFNHQGNGPCRDRHGSSDTGAVAVNRLLVKTVHSLHWMEGQMFMHTAMRRAAHAGTYRQGRLGSWDIMGTAMIAAAFAVATALIFLL